MLPRITIDLKKIERNTKAIVTTLSPLGIEVVGVVKACLGSPDVARAMRAGGASAIADSRLASLERLSGLDAPLMMLRQPMYGEVKRVVRLTDCCLVTELDALRLLSQAASALGKRYSAIVMVETGDLREGVLPADLFSFIQEAVELPSIEIKGIGTNVACLQGVPPTPAMLELLVESAGQVRDRLGIALPVVSGGNSSAWKFVEAGQVPAGVTQLRLGEAILLGQETIEFDPIAGTSQDAVVIEAEVLEVKEKPAHPIAEDMRRRAILALGSQDTCRGGLRPLDATARPLRRSSDHLVVDVTDSPTRYRAGDRMAFIPDYEAMLAAMTSPFVEKVLVAS